MPQSVEQIRRVIFNDEEIGMGFNSDTGLAVGTALEGFSIGVNPAAPGAEVVASISVINTHEELQKSLGMSLEAHGRYGFFSGSAKAEFAESARYNSTSTFLVARVVVQNPLTRGKGFQVTVPARELLNPSRVAEFKTAFGDSFVRGLQTGGEFYAVVRITSVSEATQSSLAAALAAEMNGLMASGGFKAAFETANSNERTRTEFHAMMYQKAGSAAEIAPTVGIDEVLRRYREFPSIAKASAAAYEAEIASYDTLPLPVPPAQETEDFLFALADTREKKLRYLQARNDLQFALQKPEFFRELPSADTLINTISVYEKLINTAMAHGIKLTKGQMSPPKIFDPTEMVPPIAEPSPIPLKRIKSEGLTLVAGSHSFPNNVEQILFDVPDNFQATVKISVNWGGLVAPGFGRPGMFMAARVAGIGILTTEGRYLTGKAISLESAGTEIDGVSGRFKSEEMFEHVGVPYFGDTVHLRITVNDRRVRKRGEFSTDGEIFTKLPGLALHGNGTLGPEIRLALFAWSRDDLPVKVEFSAPTIVPLEP